MISLEYRCRWHSIQVPAAIGLASRLTYLPVSLSVCLRRTDTPARNEFCCRCPSNINERRIWLVDDGLTRECLSPVNKWPTRDHDCYKTGELFYCCFRTLRQLSSSLVTLSRFCFLLFFPSFVLWNCTIRHHNQLSAKHTFFLINANYPLWYDTTLLVVACS